MARARLPPAGRGLHDHIPAPARLRTERATLAKLGAEPDEHAPQDAAMAGKARREKAIDTRLALPG